MRTEKSSPGDATEIAPGLSLAQLAAGERMSVQHVRVDPGGEVPEHDHPHEQVGFVYAGVLTFSVGDEEIEVGPGESYAIPGGEPHAAVNEGDETVEAIDVFSPPRPNPDWAE